VKSLLAREYTSVACFKGCQFQGVLVGLGAAVNQKQLVVVVATDLTQTLCQLYLQLVDHRVGIESHLTELLCHFLLVVRMGVPYTDHGVTTIEVKIFLTFVVPYFATLALYDVYVEERIYVE
jgi:hypothetical protein